MARKTENLKVLTLPNRRHPQLFVRREGNPCFISIATLLVTEEEFWKQLGYGLGITIVEKENLD